VPSCRRGPPRERRGEPGHEGWGSVAAVGRGVRAVREGDRAALPSTASDSAFRAMEEQPEGFLKAVVVP